MSKKEKLLNKARQSPSNLTFDELCKLAEYHGFVFRNQSGSHKTYRHNSLSKMLNFQPDKNNKAKSYQVKQLVTFIDENT